MEGIQHGEKKTQESIKSAAIKFKGEIIAGVNHAFAIMQLERNYPRANITSLEEGFLTSSGRFVDRREAAEIADQAAQTDEEGVESRSNPEELDSSELSKKTIH